ncbi:hypothetical protein ACWC24_31410 [Streptomyces sp. NPDC001443]
MRTPCGPPRRIPADRGADGAERADEGVSETTTARDGARWCVVVRGDDGAERGDGGLRRYGATWAR